MSRLNQYISPDDAANWYFDDSQIPNNKYEQNSLLLFEEEIDLNRNTKAFNFTQQNLKNTNQFESQKIATKQAIEENTLLNENFFDIDNINLGICLSPYFIHNGDHQNSNQFIEYAEDTSYQNLNFGDTSPNAEQVDDISMDNKQTNECESMDLQMENQHNIKLINLNLLNDNQQPQEESKEGQAKKSDNSQLLEQKQRKTPVYKKRMGRPFIGKVGDWNGKEDLVMEKRSILRACKKFFGKGHYLKWGRIQPTLQKLPTQLRKQIDEMIENFKNCTSKNESKAKKNKKKFKEYIPLVGDPCYNYSREAKERFFKNAECAFLFLLAKEHILKKLNCETFSQRANKMGQIVQEFSDLARSELEKKGIDSYLNFI